MPPRNRDPVINMPTPIICPRHSFRELCFEMSMKIGEGIADQKFPGSTVFDLLYGFIDRSTKSSKHAKLRIFFSFASPCILAYFVYNRIFPITFAMHGIYFFFILSLPNCSCFFKMFSVLFPIFPMIKIPGRLIMYFVAFFAIGFFAIFIALRIIKAFKRLYLPTQSTSLHIYSKKKAGLPPPSFYIYKSDFRRRSPIPTPMPGAGGCRTTSCRTSGYAPRARPSSPPCQRE